MPAVHVVFALLLGEAIAGEGAASSELDWWSEPAGHGGSETFPRKCANKSSYEKIQT